MSHYYIPVLSIILYLCHQVLLLQNFLGPYQQQFVNLHKSHFYLHLFYFLRSVTLFYLSLIPHLRVRSLCSPNPKLYFNTFFITLKLLPAWPFFIRSAAV